MYKTNVPDEIDEDTITVTLEDLQKILRCGAATAKKIGENADAKRCFGRRTLYSLEKIRNYIVSAD